MKTKKDEESSFSADSDSDDFDSEDCYEGKEQPISFQGIL